MSTHNKTLLAAIQASRAVDKARRAHLPQPQIRVMEALREAIDSKSSDLRALVLAGKLETDAYRQAKAEHARWTQAWNSNR